MQSQNVTAFKVVLVITGLIILTLAMLTFIDRTPILVDSLGLSGGFGITVIGSMAIMYLVSRKMNMSIKKFILSVFLYFLVIFVYVVFSLMFNFGGGPV